MGRSKILVSVAAVVLASGASTAAATTLVVDESGQLTGANEVLVNGATYNVQFLEGTCPALFGGCDAASDFTFQTEADAVAAAQALLDQVLIDAVQGQFDTNPTLTFGCGSSSCSAIVPYRLSPSQTGWVGRTAYNTTTVDAVSFAGASFHISSDDTQNPAGGPAAVFAVFSLAPAVPEPSTWAMMLLGFGAVGFGMRRRKQKLTVSYA